MRRFTSPTVCLPTPTLLSSHTIWGRAELSSSLVFFRFAVSSCIDKVKHESRFNKKIRLDSNDECARSQIGTTEVKKRVGLHVPPLWISFFFMAHHPHPPIRPHPRQTLNPHGLVRSGLSTVVILRCMKKLAMVGPVQSIVASKLPHVENLFLNYISFTGYNHMQSTFNAVFSFSRHNQIRRVSLCRERATLWPFEQGIPQIDLKVDVRSHCTYSFRSKGWYTEAKREVECLMVSIFFSLPFCHSKTPGK